MLTKSQLIQFNMEHPPTCMLGRSPKVQSDYEKFMKKDCNRGDFVACMKERLEYKKFYFVLNDFPYHTVDGIEHWVCWYGKDSKPEDFIQEIKEKKEIITYWKNYSQNMSIQEINHIHVFIQK